MTILFIFILLLINPVHSSEVNSEIIKLCKKSDDYEKCKSQFEINRTQYKKKNLNKYNPDSPIKIKVIPYRRN